MFDDSVFEKLLIVLIVNMDKNVILRRNNKGWILWKHVFKRYDFGVTCVQEIYKDDF